MLLLELHKWEQKLYLLWQDRPGGTWQIEDVSYKNTLENAEIMENIHRKQEFLLMDECKN